MTTLTKALAPAHIPSALARTTAHASWSGLLAAVFSGDRRWRALVGAMWLYFLMFALVLELKLGLAEDVRTAIADWGLVPGGLVASLLAARVAYRGFAVPTRRGWLWLALAFLSFWIGDVVYMYLEVVANVQPSPSLADVGYLAYYPLLLVGIMSFPRGISTREERVRFALDALTVAIGGAMVVWYFLLGPIFSQDMGDVSQALLAVAYPAGDLALLLGVGLIAVRRSTTMPRRVAVLFVAGLLTGLAADLVWGAASLTDAVPAGDPDVLYLLSWALLASAALLAFDGRSERATEPDRAARDSIPMLPYASVALGYGMLLVAVRGSWSITASGLVLGAGFLTALVIARQVSTVRENLSLAKHQERQKSEARFRSLVQNASDVIAVVDRQGRISYVTPSVNRTLGYPVGELLGTAVRDLIDADDRGMVDELLARVIDEPFASATYEMRALRLDGRPLVVEASLINLTHDPDIGGYVVTIRNIDDRKRLEVKLAHQAYHDPLTGVANRALFMSSTSAELARARERGHSVGLLYLDCDGFKTINDSLGHGAGDRALIEVARRVRHAVRVRDTLGRMGGDEFAILLTGAVSPESAAAACDRILASLGKPFLLEGREVSFSASIGICITQTAEEEADELVRNADIAMYLAKMRGKAGHATFEQGMQLPARERLDLAAGLRHAIEREEFELYHQPIVELATGRVVGSEALLRWHRAGADLVLPGNFIGYAEETGQIIPIGRWVLQRACAELALAAPGQFVSVNVSARQLSSLMLVTDLAAALKLTGVDPGCVVLEVTESAVMAEPELNIARLRMLKDLGVRIAVDDFGTGYSSLAYLRRLPVDEVKIDRSFVSDMDRAAGAALVNGIVSMAHSLGLTCVAEGIETPAQADALRALGCDMAQGYYFGRPAPVLDGRELSASPGVGG